MCTDQGASPEERRHRSEQFNADWDPWQSIRYAHGRHTYAPGMVRDAVMTLKTLYPDYRLKKDGTIKPPGKDSLAGIALRQDYLDDLFAADR
jgi:hypothetical protein